MQDEVMDYTAKMRYVIEAIRDKPGLILFSSDYHSIRTFLEGFLYGIQITTGVNIAWKISRWFQEKISEQTSVYFTHQITTHFKNYEDQELVKILLSVIEDYLDNFPKWYDERG